MYISKLQKKFKFRNLLIIASAISHTKKSNKYIYELVDIQLPSN